MNLKSIKKQLKLRYNLLPYHARFWKINMSNEGDEKTESSTFYNANNIKIYKFYKPISKIINIPNAHPKSK